MQGKYLSYLLILILFIQGYSYAQEEGQRSVQPDRITLEKKGLKYQQTGIVEVPFDEKSPFVTFSMKLFSTDLEGIDIEVAYSENGTTFSRYKEIGLEEHGPQIDEFKTTELVFLDDEVRVVKYRITSSSQFSISLEYHFYSPPEHYTLEERELPLQTSRTGCMLPDYITRTGWNCPDGQDFSSGTPSFTNVTHLVVHHSAGVNSSSNWAAVVLSIWNYHRFTNGWSDIGYNFLIDPNGVIYEGRGGNEGYTFDVLPAATCGSNSGTMAVCMLGNFEEVIPQADAVLSLERLLAWKSEDNSIDPLGSSSLNNYGVLNHIFGHLQGCATACPGQSLFNMLADIRNGVDEDVIMLCDPTPENIIYVNHVIDDNNDGESTGDDDGVVESGETIEVFLTLENIGGDDAYNVQASITTVEPCVSFIDAHIPFGDIAPGQEVTDGDYDIVFSPSCTDGTIAFPLTIASDDSTWYDTIYIDVYNTCKPVAIIAAEVNTGSTPFSVTYTSQSVNADLVEWTFPGGVPSAVSGSETVQVIYMQPGTYSTSLTAYNECGSHDTTISVLVDIINVALEDQIKPVLYPNPASSVLYIELQQYIENAELEIINTTGMQMLTKKFSGSLFVLPMDDLASGLYILKVTDPSTKLTWTGKVEKE